MAKKKKELTENKNVPKKEDPSSEKISNIFELIQGLKLKDFKDLIIDIDSFFESEFLLQKDRSYLKKVYSSKKYKNNPVDFVGFCEKYIGALPSYRLK